MYAVRKRHTESYVTGWKQSRSRMIIEPGKQPDDIKFGNFSEKKTWDSLMIPMIIIGIYPGLEIIEVL